MKSVANLKEKNCGNLDIFYNPEEYSIEQFRRDAESFKELFIANEKKFNIENKKKPYKKLTPKERIKRQRDDRNGVCPGSTSMSLIEKSKTYYCEECRSHYEKNEKHRGAKLVGYDNFLSLCYIYTGIYVNENLNYIEDRQKGLLSGQNKILYTYLSTPKEGDTSKKSISTDHVAIAQQALLFIFSNDENIDKFYDYINKELLIVGGFKDHFSLSLKDFIGKKSSTHQSFADNLLLRSKQIVTGKTTYMSKGAKSLIEEEKLIFEADDEGFFLKSINEKRRKEEEIFARYNRVSSLKTEAKEIKKSMTDADFLDEKRYFEQGAISSLDYGLGAFQEEEKEYVNDGERILKQYTILPLPKTETSQAENIEDIIHAAKKGKIYSNEDLVKILRDLSLELGFVGYGLLYLIFKTRLTSISIEYDPNTGVVLEDELVKDKVMEVESEFDAIFYSKEKSED